MMINTQQYMTTDQKIINEIGSGEINQGERTIRIFENSGDSLLESKCLFCDKKLEYNLIVTAFNFSVYQKDYCDCDGSIEYWKHYHELYSAYNKIESDRWEKETTEKLVRGMMDRSRIGKRFRDRTFERFEINAKNKSAYDICLNYVENFKGLSEKGNGLVMLGAVGSGKTHLAASIANYIIAEHKIQVVFGSVVSLLGEIKATYSDDSTINETEILNELKKTRLLIIDDLGKEKTSDWVSEIFYSIINYRYENYLPVIVTSNLTLKELAEKVGEATVSRLLGTSRVIKFEGKDYRTENRGFGKGEIT